VYTRQSLLVLGSDSTQGALFLGLLVQQGLTNLSETHWFSVLSVDFVIMTLAMTALGRAVLDLRLRSCFRQPRVAPHAPRRAWNGGHAPPWGARTATRPR
jgi:hypothetical protein